MAIYAFTRNHSDLSTDAGYQFEFYCDCCGNGVKSTFIESSTYGQSRRTETFGGAAGVLGSLLGGRANNLGWAVERGTDLLRDQLDQSPQWRREQESAFQNAQGEVQRYFRRCPACNKWVCADCWNEEQGLCVDCSPRESAYVAKARAAAMQRNIDEAAEAATVWTGQITARTTVCPNCGKPAGEGKFCNSCGAPLSRNKCPQCGGELPAGVKFCPQCGAKTAPAAPARPTNCPQCGAPLPDNARFCGSCGNKIG